MSRNLPIRLTVTFFAFVLLAAAAHAQPAAEPTEPPAAIAWFTDAIIDDAQQVPQPGELLPAAPGSYGQGVRLTKPVPVDDPVLSREHGYISFWIKPDWNGNDGKTHRILRIGDPETNGLLVEKSPENMLRYVMASPEKITASRADVSAWKAGQWHHIVVTWMFHDGKPLGTPLWIDHKCVDSAIAAGNTFMDPDAMTDTSVWIGDETSGAVIDELIFRPLDEPRRQITLVYRDHFLTAPYTAIKVNHEACFVRSDRRVVQGAQKQFGLLAMQEGQWVPVTNFDVRYGQWTEFDAKPFITWSTSDTDTATVDDNGRVDGKTVGDCILTATFRGMEAAYDVHVIPVDQPDLVLMCVSRLPRYKWQEEKNRPEPGDTVTFVARVTNYGYKPVPAGAVVRIEYVPDANGNFRLDDDEQPVKTEQKTIDQELAPRDEVEVEFPWTFADGPVWTRVTLDPENEIDEICEVNNQRTELSTARPIHFGYDPRVLDRCYDERTINHVGSFCYYDWINGQKDRLDHLVRDAVCDTTTPEGIHDAFRTDKITALDMNGRDVGAPFEQERDYYDGGFPVNEPVDFMAIDSAIIHEFGHTILALPDLYGYPVEKRSVLLKDENDVPYAGGPLLPTIVRDMLPQTSAVNDPCDVGYNPLMVSCHQWLHPANAGQAHYYRNYRGPRFWGTQGRNIADREHFLKIYDVNDEPLAGAAVYVYHVSQTGSRSAGTKFFVDRPKFIGHTDDDGRFEFPGTTDRDWDDPNTDLVEGEFPVWNPFGVAKSLTGAPADVAFTPNVWCVEGLLLVKIVSGTQTEFQWMPLTVFNIGFFKGYVTGNTHRGTYVVRTNLKPSSGETPIVRRQIPDAIRETNLAPVAEADVTTLELDPGQEFTIDGSASHDPEGQPLIYWWDMRGPFEPNFSDQPTFKGKAPRRPGRYECAFFVIDGLRPSEPVWINIRVRGSRGGRGWRGRNRGD